MQKIVRKFLIKTLPNLFQLPVIHYKRYFLSKDINKQIRIQQKGNKYELEEITDNLNLVRSSFKKDISKTEFDNLRSTAVGYINRDSYLISNQPTITIKVYHDKFEGLARAEVDFESEKEANNFTPPTWFGLEITNSPLVQDIKLLDLKAEDFKKLIEV